MSDSLTPTVPLARSIRQLKPYFAEHRAGLLAVVVLAIGTASLSALEPLVLKGLFDRFLEVRGVGEVLVPFSSLLGIVLARELLLPIQDRLFWRSRLGVNFGLLQATVDRLHSLPLEYHRDQSVGATMTKIERGISMAMAAFTEVLVQLFPALIYLCVSVVVMVQLDFRLFMLSLLFAPLPALVGAFAAREQSQRERSLMQLWTRIFARFNEVLSGIVVVKSFVMEEQEKRRFLNGVQNANAVVLRGVGTDAKVNAIKSAIMTCARLSALGLGGTLVMRRQISVGTLIAFVAYLGGLFQSVQTLTGMYQTLRRASAAVSSILSILEAQDSLGDSKDARDVTELSGDIEFRDVSFGYRPGLEVLRNVSLRVRPGEMVALVGPSGAGKSTMMALLQRLYDPTSGSILVDGQDLKALKQRSLRFQIGVVLQEGMLFSDSIRDNIAFGRPRASAAEIEAAARAANAHEFICRLPEGYETQVGERGSKLSGGERQRVAIARALLKNAPILILDEATSALDAESEAKVQAALTRLIAGRTTFVIAHRLSTITSADRILVLKDGGIAEMGNHRELMARGGYYASLVRQQSRGLLDGSGQSLASSDRRSHPPEPLRLGPSSRPSHRPVALDTNTA
ncbi:MAG TPA: ABC transporter ATP-binding protein [Polyangiaceae bacterium]|nr:ABC transporter ATP-binding protein [Polyangiaceae bacterium]